MYQSIWLIIWTFSSHVMNTFHDTRSWYIFICFFTKKIKINVFFTKRHLLSMARLITYLCSNERFMFWTNLPFNLKRSFYKLKHHVYTTWVFLICSNTNIFISSNLLNKLWNTIINTCWKFSNIALTCINHSLFPCQHYLEYRKD